MVKRIQIQNQNQNQNQVENLFLTEGSRWKFFIEFEAADPELADVGKVGIKVVVGVGLSKQGTSFVKFVPFIELKEMESWLSQTLTDVLFLCQKLSN